METERLNKVLDIPESSVTVQTDSVGQRLRLLREEKGLELRQISETLCIRYPYLEAIENSSFNDLPGPTYALGFVKAYAEHLGLDSDEIVELFKIEQLGLNSKTELVFPSPLSEGKVPSAAILAVSVLLALVAYCGWAYFLANDEQVAEIVPPLPEQLSESSKVIKPKMMPVNELPNTQNTGTGSSETQAPQSNQLPNTQNTGTGSPGTQAPQSTDKKNTLSSEQKIDNPNSMPDTTTSEPQPQNNTIVPPDGDTEEVAAVIPNEPQTDTQDPQSLQVSEETTMLPDEATEQESLPKIAAKREAKTYGDESGGGRVVIRATGSTWVEIRDQLKGEVLLTRLLYAGDRYLMPNRDGLVMLTGNAGGLEISVDGEVVPSIGPSGAVRRNIPLDPNALIEGRAVRENEDEDSQQLDANADQD